MVNAQKESLLCFGREQDMKGERGNRPTGACLLCSLFFPQFPLFFPLFSLLSFSFLSPVFLLLCFFFYSVNAFCFSIPFSGHGKGPFIVPAMASFLPLCLVTAFVWSGRTCRPPKGSSVCHSPLPDKGRFVSFVSPP